MCNFASFIITKTGEFWAASDKHEDIISEHCLSDLDEKRPPGIVRVEILPNEQSRKDLSTWAFGVDQDMLPDWTFSGDPELERRSREALARRAAAENWFAEVISQQPVVGYAGTATAGDGGTATAGARGTATAGDRGTATAGDDGTATAGDGGTATAGERGILSLRWWDWSRYRIATFYVGENGVLPNVKYRVDEKGQIVKAEYASTDAGKGE